jgi:competence protein ComEC
MSIFDETRKPNHLFSDKPFLWVSIFFITGIILANFSHLPFIFLYGPSFVCLIGAFLSINSKKLFFVCALLLILSLGFLRFKIAELQPENSIGSYAKEEREEVLLIGTIKSNPTQTEGYYGDERIDFLLQPSYLIKEDKKIDTSGLVRVTLYEKPLENFKYGQSYILEGLLSKPKEVLRETQFHYREYLARRGIYALFYSRKYDGYLNLNLDQTNPVRKLAYNLKNSLNEKYQSLLPPPYSHLLSAFILGDREDIPEDIYNSFKHTGSVHMLAISGLHIGIVIFIILFILKLFNIRRKPAAFVCIGFLIFYCVLTGSRASVMRASIMGSVFLLGWALDRESNVYNSLGFACFCLLLFNSFQLFDVGFQLSFTAVLSIIYFTPKLDGILRKLLNYKSKMKRYISRGVTVSLCAWLGVLPLVLYYFGISSTMSVLTNLIIVPLLAAVLSLGFLVSIISYVWFDFAYILSQTLHLVLFIMVRIISLIEKFPFSYFKYDQMSLATITAYYVFLLLIFNNRHIIEKIFYKDRTY